MKRSVKILIAVSVVAALAIVAGPLVLGGPPGGKAGTASAGGFGPPSGAPSGGPAGGAPGAATPATVYSVKVQKLTTASLRTYLEVNGDVVTSTNVDIFPDTGGRLAAVLVQVGDQVEKGKTVIAQVDPSKPGSNYALSPVYSPLTGTITSLTAQLGATVTGQSSLGTVGVLTDLLIESKVPEVDVAAVVAGLKAEITFPAFPGRVFTATVTRVDPVVDVTSRTKKIRLRLSGDSSGVNLGMFSRVKLYLAARPARVVAPLESVITRSGQSYAFVIEGEKTVRRVVKTGITVDGQVEILDGLKAGETLVVKGQELLDDGASVRVIP
jgi:multidrug efflux pump subunit AcrA (membrane-fusion protein)